MDVGLLLCILCICSIQILKGGKDSHEGGEIPSLNWPYIEKTLPMVSAVQKLIILSEDCSYWTLVFVVEYCQNTATSLQGHIWFAISMWVGLHPHTSPMIPAISILLILVSE